MDAVKDEDLVFTNIEKSISLTIKAIGSPPRRRSLFIHALYAEITEVKAQRKPGKFALELFKKEEKRFTAFSLMGLVFA